MYQLKSFHFIRVFIKGLGVPQFQTGFKYWMYCWFEDLLCIFTRAQLGRFKLVRFYAVWNTNYFLYFNLVLILFILGERSFFTSHDSCYIC